LGLAVNDVGLDNHLGALCRCVYRCYCLEHSPQRSQPRVCLWSSSFLLVQANPLERCIGAGVLLHDVGLCVFGTVAPINP